MTLASGEPEKTTLDTDDDTLLAVKEQAARRRAAVIFLLGVLGPGGEHFLRLDSASVHGPSRDDFYDSR